MLYGAHRANGHNSPPLLWQTALCSNLIALTLINSPRGILEKASLTLKAGLAAASMSIKGDCGDACAPFLKGFLHGNQVVAPRRSLTRTALP
jgi:hypothetical protein